MTSDLEITSMTLTSCQTRSAQLGSIVTIALYFATA